MGPSFEIRIGFQQVLPRHVQHDAPLDLGFGIGEANRLSAAAQAQPSTYWIASVPAWIVCTRRLLSVSNRTPRFPGTVQ